MAGTPEAALAEIDSTRRRTFEAYAARDLGTYLDMYAPGATYRDARGVVAQREKLGRDTAAEWTVVRSPKADWRRESWSMQDDGLREIVRQQLSAVVHGLLFFKRDVEIERRVEYTWRQVDGRWRVVEAVVLDERRAQSPLRFGPHPAGCVTAAVLASVLFALYLLLS